MSRVANLYTRSFLPATPVITDDRIDMPNFRDRMIAAEHQITEMAALAAQFVNTTDRHIFLTGKAGTGKTTFLRQLAANTHKRFVILAPTGIAALNAGGVTIHSQFLLPLGSYIPERKLPADIGEYGNFHDRDSLARRHPLNAIRRNVLRDVDLLVIDEVSMLRADLLDAIDFRMRSVRQRHDRPFGGAQVLMIGDLFQLPPVVKDDEWRVLQRWYRSMHFFEAHVLQQSGYAHIELDKIFRQKDEKFIRILNNLRDDKVTAQDVADLNVHYKPAIGREETEGVITLTTHNWKADELNQGSLAALPGKVARFEAEIEGEFPQSMFPVLRELELKEGAQIMFVRNDPDKMYFNGKLARVEKISSDSIEVRMLDDDQPYTLKRAIWENKRYTIDPVTKEQKEEILGTFEQYPVKLAWAITVHKSQGLTFDRAIIDVGQAFAPGQVYVALSRLRSLEGLILRTPIDPSVVSCDREVVAFSERRHAQQALPDQLRDQQREYLRMMLSSAFDLGDPIRRVEVLIRENDPSAFELEAMRTAMPDLLTRLKAEEENSRKFQNQLLRLLHEEDREKLLERIDKGGAYFSDHLNGCMKDLLKHLAAVEKLSRSKEYAEALREVDALLVKKLLTIARAGNVTTAILNGTEVQRVQELENALKQRRVALMDEVRSWAEENLKELSTKSGRRRRKDKNDVFSEPPERKKKIKGETYLRTYVMFKEGTPIDEIAAERSLTRSTVEGHIARGISEGVIEIDSVMPAEKRDTIAEWMQENKAGLNEARANFGDRFSYGELRMVQAWLKRGEE